MGAKTLTILGSTGSIGRNTLDVASRFPDRFRVHALAANNNVGLLREQIETYRPAVAVAYDEEAAERLRAENPRGGATAILSGMEGLLEAAGDARVEQVVSGMVGAVGLRPTYAAIDAGKQVAVANKETLVLAGELMVRRAGETGSTLLPMDSEHNAIFQCLAGDSAGALDHIVLTASGGPFRDLPLERFPEITLEQALDHPNWKMGPKITIDSATMMNKGLEVIEAHWLFGLPPERIRVLLHRQSIVHSLVTFVDGSVIAQLGLPDMRTPISYCLGYPERLSLELPRLNLAEVGRLDFEEVSPEKYGCLFLALDALELGGGAPAALNGANEEVVAAYLNGAFPFLNISEMLHRVMAELKAVLASNEAPPCLARIDTVDDALAADRWGREAAQRLVAN
ncbi:MAG: 1-deoxy-D-xylulose-5-phosphate reductoisomerase [SAR324 cluster bacterium]|nr:1-deoxy-D-xylulose-5-phosphate reductoisomerase [SAR324 cluster bacterium]